MNYKPFCLNKVDRKAACILKKSNILYKNRRNITYSTFFDHSGGLLKVMNTQLVKIVHIMIMLNTVEQSQGSKAHWGGSSHQLQKTSAQQYSPTTISILFSACYREPRRFLQSWEIRMGEYIQIVLLCLFVLCFLVGLSNAKITCLHKNVLPNNSVCSVPSKTTVC